MAGGPIAAHLLTPPPHTCAVRREGSGIILSVAGGWVSGNGGGIGHVGGVGRGSCVYCVSLKQKSGAPSAIRKRSLPLRHMVMLTCEVLIHKHDRRAADVSTCSGGGRFARNGFYLLFRRPIRPPRRYGLSAGALFARYGAREGWALFSLLFGDPVQGPIIVKITDGAAHLVVSKAQINNGSMPPRFLRC